MLQPFTHKDFAIRPLADRIADLKYLMFLYPNQSKDTVFGKYYTQLTEHTSSQNNGYVMSQLVNVVHG